MTNPSTSCAMLMNTCRIKPCFEGSKPEELYVCRTCRPQVKPKEQHNEPMKRMKCIACGQLDVYMYKLVTENVKK